MIGVINPVCQLHVIPTPVAFLLIVLERLYVVGNATLRGPIVLIYGAPWRKNPRRSRHYDKP